MVRRIGIWALVGFGVALIWALVFYLVGPSMWRYPNQGAVLDYLGHSAIVPVTAPVALLRSYHYPITWYWSAVINAAMYACVGLIVEMIRVTVRMSGTRLRH